MRFVTWLALLPTLATPALAVDPTCEIYLAAAEKSANQPARHTVTDVGDGTKLEAIVLGDQLFVSMEGKWQRMPGAHLMKAERQLVAGIRSGKYPMTGCRKLASEKFDGVSTTVIVYTLNVGPGSGEARTYINSDGLVIGQVSGKTSVRHRYTGVKAPM